MAVSCWRLNADPRHAAPGVGTVALRADQLSPAHDGDRPVVALHDALVDPLPPASDEVEVTLPAYRGNSVVPLLAWLVATRLAGPEATVAWRMTKHQGPDSVLRLLTSLGWRLERRRDRPHVVLHGRPPDPDDVRPPPEPASFVAQLGEERLELAADYGVFSPRRVDDGTRLLFDVALRSNRPVGSLADIGIGYGALAVGLVRNGLAPRAAGTDVDCFALLLARRNAEAAGVALSLACSSDPLAVAATDLTVCNVPTHLAAADTALLMGGLAERTRHGRLQLVVHASLEERYRRHLDDHGLRVQRDATDSHVVLTADR